MPPITPTEVTQRIKDRRLNLDLTQDPASPARFFVNNVFNRVFAYLVGLGENAAIPIEATASGELKVAVVGSGFGHNDTVAKGNAADAYAEKVFDEIVSRIDIFVWDQQATIKRKPTAADAYDDEIVVDADTFYSFDCSTYALSYKNTTPGSTAVIQVVGWY